MEWAVVPIEYGQGLDSKTDPKAVKAGKFLRLENAVFTNPGEIEKRNGYTALPSTVYNVAGNTTLAGPTLLTPYNNELIAADSAQLLSLSPNASAWTPKGSYVSMDLSRKGIDLANSDSGFSDCAVAGKYTVYAWSTYESSSVLFSKTYGSVVDNDTGDFLATILLSTSTTSGLATPVRCIALGGTVLAVAYVKADNSAVVIRTVSVSGGTAAFSAAASITTSFVAGARSSFDISQTATGGVVFYPSNPSGTVSVTTTLLDTAGLPSPPTSIADSSRATDVFHVSVNTVDGSIWIYWFDETISLGSRTAYSLQCAIYDASLSVIHSKFQITTVAAPYYSANLIASTISAVKQQIIFSIYVASGASSSYVDVSNISTATTGAVVTTAFFANGIIPYSRPFTYGGHTYAVFIYRGINFQIGSLFSVAFFPQSTYFIVDLSTTPSIPFVIARFGYGVASSICTTGITLGFMPNCFATTASIFLFTCGIVTQLVKDSSSFVGTGSAGTVGTFAYTFNLGSPSAYYAKSAGDLTILNGGVLQAYDGQTCAEWGFHLAPEITNIATTTGSITDGTYSYIAIYQWIDANGNLHQSLPSLAVPITLSGGPKGTIVTITTAFLSGKNNVTVALFRTQASRAIYYQVSDAFVLTSASAATNPTVSITDTLVDASLPGNNLAYAYPGSSTLENAPTPPATAIVAHNNRLWMVNAESRNEIRYSNTNSVGDGLSAPAELLLEVDPKFGPLFALGEMDEKLVAFTNTDLFIESGDGADATGANSTLSPPQPIPSDVGCDQLKSVITTPSGILFHSENGIYILSRALQISYIGAEVEQFNTKQITSANLIQGKSQIRFLLSTADSNNVGAIVYDYIFNQWGTFTNHIGNAATIWSGAYVYAQGANVLEEDFTGLYTDNGTSFSLLLQTGWLTLSSIQNFQRVRRFINLGSFTNGSSVAHAISVAAAYDFSTTFQPAISYAFGAVNAAKTFQYRERLPIQKCDSISLLIQEVTNSVSKESLNLTNMSFEAGIKRGVNKLGAQFSVG